MITELPPVNRLVQERLEIFEALAEDREATRIHTREWHKSGRKDGFVVVKADGQQD